MLQDPPFYRMFNAGLILLLLLHWYWFSLILRVVHTRLTRKTMQDVREDDD